jgi:hypothetical protein
VGCYRATVRLLIHFHERRAHRLYSNSPLFSGSFLVITPAPPGMFRVAAFKKYSLTNLNL